MPKSSLPKSAFARGAVTPADVLDFHRAIFGDARMEADDSEAQSQQSTEDGESSSQGDDGGDDETEGMSPEQLAEHYRQKYEHSKKTSRRWENRAKASDRVARSDFDAVVAERDQLRQSVETDHEKALREARDEGATEARQQGYRESVSAMLRMGLRANGMTDDDEIEEVISTTNFDAFRGDDGVIDDKKITSHVQRQTATVTNSWPDVGQGRPASQSHKGMAAGSDLYDEMHGKKQISQAS